MITFLSRTKCSNETVALSIFTAGMTAVLGMSIDRRRRTARRGGKSKSESCGLRHEATRVSKK